jgi:hypothetical protein
MKNKNKKSLGIKILKRERNNPIDWLARNIWSLTLDFMFGFSYQKILLYNIKRDRPEDYKKLVESGIIKKYYPALLNVKIIGS